MAPNTLQKEKALITYYLLPITYSRVVLAMALSHSGDLDKLSKNSRVLWDIFLSGRGLFPLLKTAAELFACPVLLRSNSVYCVSPDKNTPIMDEAYAMRLLSWCAGRNQGGIDLINQIPQALLGSPELKSIIFSPLVLQNQTIGSIALCSYDDSFGEVEQQLLGALCGMCAVLVGQNPFSSENRGNSNAALFCAMLSGESVDRSVFQSNPQLNMLREGRGMQILAVDPHGADGAALKNLQEVCCGMVTHSLQAIYRDYIVLLYHGKRKYPLSEHNNFLEFLKRHGCRCGLSREFADIAQISSHFEQARISCEIGGKLYPEQTLCEYEDFSMEHSLILAARQLPAEALVSPQLRSLMDYDSSKNAGLIETLKIYLDNINNLNGAAEALHIHRNTLFYRLRKIEDLTGWDLDSGRCLNKINFYLKAEQLRQFL